MAHGNHTTRLNKIEVQLQEQASRANFDPSAFRTMREKRHASNVALANRIVQANSTNEERECERVFAKLRGLDRLRTLSFLRGVSKFAGGEQGAKLVSFRGKVSSAAR